MVTGHEDEPHSRLSVDLVGAEGKDLARRRAWTEILVGLAMHFASLAADAIRLVMVKCVHTHAVGPPVARRLIWTMVSVMAQPPPAGSNSYSLPCCSRWSATPTPRARVASGTVAP